MVFIDTLKQTTTNFSANSATFFCIYTSHSSIPREAYTCGQSQNFSQCEESLRPGSAGCGHQAYQSQTRPRSMSGVFPPKECGLQTVAVIIILRLEHFLWALLAWKSSGFFKKLNTTIIPILQIRKHQWDKFWEVQESCPRVTYSVTGGARRGRRQSSSTKATAREPGLASG